MRIERATITIKEKLNNNVELDFLTEAFEDMIVLCINRWCFFVIVTIQKNFFDKSQAVQNKITFTATCMKK